MDKDRVEGPIKEGVGKAKEEWGDLTDNPETEIEGKKDQAEGKIQEAWGEVKDTARDAVDDDES
ncbi:MAG TPA: CsbD family protein [Candidatus Dormibacteraeota bacterium]|nr:CsbD family protein [Candidatus Dormibacteraeota bacterium]